MTRRNKKSKKSLGNSVDRVDQAHDDTPATAEEQVLLGALLSFISPHIGAAGDTDSQKDMAQKIAGPQAKKFIAALKEFISSLVGVPAKTEVETTIKVALNEGDVLQYSPDNVGGDQVEGMVISPSPLVGLNSSDVNVESQYLALSTPIVTIPSLNAKIYLALRRHVFNKMPIRLLMFVERGPILEISLVERAAIYEHLVPLLPPWHSNDEYTPGWWETEDEAISKVVEKYAKYAILSHTWLRQSPELTYGDWKGKSFDAQGPGYHKLVNFCRVAYTKHKLTLGWMDTVCINKDSSSELDESIRSMYQWYKRSEVCVVHLADTDSLAEMHSDTWFTRGWTLQELLAPSVLKFYNHLWVTLVDSENDKINYAITTKIQEATTISAPELRDIQSEYTPISRRMQLAAHRKATREEDTAYSLMGLFNVSFTTAYGEGADRAFYRLVQEILNSMSDGILDLFNSAGEDWSPTSKLLPTSPRQYLERTADISLGFLSPIEPLMSTHMGVCIPLLMMPGIRITEGNFSTKPCGDYSALVTISPVGNNGRPLMTYALLQQQDYHLNNYLWFFKEEGGQCQVTFAVFNFRRGKKGIQIPSKCIAIPFGCDEHAGKVTGTGWFSRIYTKEPVVFDVLQRNPYQYNRSAEDYMVPIETDYISIPQQDLAKHGIQLVSKYV